MAEKIKRTGYVSEIDQFLRDFDKNRKTFPDSRIKEIEKHKKIFAKRDGIVDESSDFIWKDF